VVRQWKTTLPKNSPVFFPVLNLDLKNPHNTNDLNVKEGSFEETSGRAKGEGD
jgi:hypothetical protein